MHNVKIKLLQNRIDNMFQQGMPLSTIAYILNLPSLQVEQILEKR
jgi:hypothetical protein